MNPFGEAELDASMELLAFMWTAAGRDPVWLTPEALLMVRLSIVQNFALLPRETQYAMINAKALHAEMKSAWDQATPEQQMLLAYQYGQALDSLGLQDPQAALANVWMGGMNGDGSTSGSEQEDGSLAGLAQTTAWNLAQKSSGGW